MHCFIRIAKSPIGLFILSFSLSLLPRIYAQQGQLSGDLMLNTNFYDRDSVIGANTTQYLHEMSSSEAWLTLNYKIEGFTLTARFDLFNNSPLLNPDEAFTGQGIGFYSINKKVEKLDITAGYFYDQFGTGIIFRAYEDRALGLDYAINGLRLKYDFNDRFRIKGFTGRQKTRFDLHPQVMKGLNAEYDLKIGQKIQLNAGSAFLNRTIENRTMTMLANEINTYSFDDIFIPKYNLYALSLYNTLVFKNLSLYTEYAWKSSEAIKNKDGDKFILSDGSVMFTSLNYSRKGFGISIQHKFARTFPMRTSPFMTLLDGNMNYMPPMSKQHAKILAARYMISALEIGEEAYMIDLTFSPNKKNTITANFSLVQDNEDITVFRELYIDYYRKFSKSVKINVGLQSVLYNKEVYQKHLEEFKDGTMEPAEVHTLTPLAELTWKLSSKRSLRCEIQYLRTEQDHGDFAFGLLEYNIVPHWSFSVSDMINTKPKKLDEIKHYFNVSAFYTYKKTRISAGYMKQVEGVVCTGGVCRVEPAFSGVKCSFTTSF